MTVSLKDNAYHVLGLTGTATNRQILQRANEIIQRLKIEDLPEYELDIKTFKNYRTESLVRDALRRLQAPKSRLTEYFFWFRIADDVDKQAVHYLAQKEFDRAISVWEAESDDSSEVGLAHKRNLALVLIISILQGNESSGCIDASLTIWASLLDSPKFWSAFASQYKQDAEQISNEAIEEFHRNASRYLSDIYAEIQEVRGGDDYVYRFNQMFNTHGQKIEEKILNPVFQRVQMAIEALEQLKLGETDHYDRAKAGQIKGPLEIIQAELNKLIDAGLYEDSSTKVLRDRAATALRNVVLDIHNHQNDFDTSIKLLQFAEMIAGTESLRALLKTEIEQIEERIGFEKGNTLAIDIPGTFGGGTMIFEPDHMTYNGQEIYYKDATSLAYHATRQSISFVPMFQTYSFMVGTPEQSINTSWGTTLYINNEKKQDVWQRLASIAAHIVEPHIVEKLVRHIFEEGKSIQIGELEFTRQGYSRSRSFSGREIVPWDDKIFVPDFDAGNVTVWKNKDGKGVLFASIPMSKPNAVVLPELVKACVNEYANERT